jgi:hypothetical protein
METARLKKYKKKYTDRYQKKERNRIDRKGIKLSDGVQRSPVMRMVGRPFLSFFVRMGVGNRIIMIVVGMDKSGIPHIETYIEKNKERL